MPQAAFTGCGFERPNRRFPDESGRPSRKAAVAILPKKRVQVDEMKKVHP
jgi:hypothetical protein